MGITQTTPTQTGIVVATGIVGGPTAKSKRVLDLMSS